MSTMTHDAWRNLGPATEQLITTAFADRALIAANIACRILGVDVKTLGALVERGALRYVLVGKSKRYTEADLRALLSGEIDPPCPSTSQKTAATGNTISRQKVVAFTALRASKASARPNR